MRTISAGLGAAAVVLFFANVLLGSYLVSLPDFFRLLAGENIPGAGFIVLENRLPRAVAGTLVGVAFGLAGSIFQTMLRNPLASPDIIGISYGASASAVAAMVLFGAAGFAVSAAAMGGALAVALLIYLLSHRQAGPSNAASGRLVLVGIGFAAVLQALVHYLLTRADIQTAQAALVWLTGSLNSSNWDRAGALAGCLLVLLPAVAALSRSLRGLEMGDDAAAGLGVKVAPARLYLMAAAVLLAAAATAAAGPVAFISFLAAPIARRLLGGRGSLTVSALVGTVIVLAADFTAATLVPQFLPGATALPVGVVTGALGAPFLLWLLVSTNRVGRGG
ncbi:iron chelate uptake ABC transporter family permease subunit [Arthrobacter sp. I2-34]|uniref:Iron chelate uptake ABC transporter family permease subunit n=1 Tax=Arthrobacter hankyongi TaxID=2904801 RepID=A0ABS9L9E3_9MICC|nr:iron chelate uptake ABC transporter family permease subunit [Arthrobacter hankyongi]MCG2623255.1 iron chelate uptake ABC transporter family permease subunit [Arthrobacter hankyongi]